MKLAKKALLLTLASAAAWAQVNVGEQMPEAGLPFAILKNGQFSANHWLNLRQRRAENSKFQAPTSREASSSQIPIWHLEFLWSLGFDAFEDANFALLNARF